MLENQVNLDKNLKAKEKKMKKNLGERVKKLREEKNLTKTALAKAIGISHPMVYYIEAGKRTPNLFKFYKLAEQLETSLDYLVGNTNIQKPNSENKKSKKD